MITALLEVLVILTYFSICDLKKEEKFLYRVLLWAWHRTSCVLYHLISNIFLTEDEGVSNVFIISQLKERSN